MLELKVRWCIASIISLYQKKEAEGLGALISVQLAKSMLGIILVGMLLLPAKAEPDPEHPSLARCGFHPSHVLLEPQKWFWRSRGAQLEDGDAVSVFSSLLALICWMHGKGSCLQRDNPRGSGAGSSAGRAASGSARRGQLVAQGTRGRAAGMMERMADAIFGKR